MEKRYYSLFGGVKLKKYLGELEHFFEEDDITLLKHGSVLKSNVIDEDATEIEDIDIDMAIESFKEKGIFIDI